VGLRAGLDAVEKKKISCTRRESDPNDPGSSYSLCRLSYPDSFLLLLLLMPLLLLQLLKLFAIYIAVANAIAILHCALLTVRICTPVQRL
jgi:hypothetical protein